MRERDEHRLADTLEELLLDAARLRMVADVPVGVFLSGGLDSSLVTALLASESAGGLRTFTIGFTDPRYDESQHAAAIARYLGTDHHAEIVDVRQALEVLPRWAELYDEPFGDSSGIPTFLVSQIARQHVKVALSADGGDELFCGYGNYAHFRRRLARLRNVPRSLGNLLAWLGDPARADAIAGAVAVLPRRFRAAVEAGPLHKLQALARVLPYATPGQIYESGLSHFSPQEREQLVGKRGNQRALTDDYPGEFLEQMALWDLHHYLPDDILTKVDRATMAVGLEGREPLLDHRLVEFALRLPLHLRDGTLGSKHLLRRVLYRHVPREMVLRPKQGFAIPLARWLAGDLAPLLRRLFDPARLHGGVLEPKEVQRVYASFVAGNARAATKVWFLAAFEMWRERWYA
jgi:asparagine synthase (glutamine-hydrolysing)